MHVITKRRLRKFWENPKHPHAERPLLDWYQAVTDAEWHRFADVKMTFNSCDQVGSKTVFDVGGNRYRIIAFIDYESQRVYIRAVLDHKEYDKGNWKNDTFGDDWKPFNKSTHDQRNGQKP
jgi:mRNA interferase HigB